MGDMIDRVAAALSEALQDTPFEYQSEAGKQIARAAARAALEAMREPSTEMIAHGQVATQTDDLDPSGNKVVVAYRAMIDAALARSREP